jgi:hypothetical protein
MFLGKRSLQLLASAALTLADYNYVPDLEAIGSPCFYHGPDAKTIEGSCVTVDSNGHNYTCRDQQGFFVSGLCWDNVPFYFAPANV